jgi:NADPH-dependent 2,4-dienoyl-CoA reductase/sulfur reductase-like enzyme
MAGYHYLIIGGGMAADAAVGGIRELDGAGTIGLVGAEAHRPYNRPPLSKALWKGESEDSIWRTHAAQGVSLHLGRRAVRLDPRAKSVTDDCGDVYRFEKLLLATGGAPRRFPLASPRVIHFRTLDDYRRLRDFAARQQRFVVVGGGFIGSEVAAALRLNGRDVTMLFPEAGLGGRVFAADLSAFLVRYYREKGVQVLTGENVAAVEERNAGVVVRTTGGREVVGDVVVAGLGIEPEVALAEQAGLRVENGIVVDEHLRASHPDVSAAGDVASFYSPALGSRLRVEHEDNANTMGRAAGRAMAGDAEPYRHLPFFYSDLFDLGYEAVGEVDARLETVADWKEPHREGVVYYLRNGRVRGVLLWNTWGQVDPARALIAEPGPFRPADLKGRLPA